MSEQDPRPTDGVEPPAYGPGDNPARYGAPLPPPPVPLPMTSPSATPPPGRRRRGRLVAVGTALAVVAVAGGAGFALGRLGDHGHPTADGAASAPRAPSQGFGDPFRGTPFQGQGGSEESPFDSVAGGPPASDSQLTGLVRVASTLGYQDGRAAGTGMILTSTGEVVTNHHVVEGSTRLQVTVMSTGKSYRATVVGTDAQDDVAVLQLQGASGLPTVTTDTAGVSVGDPVTAVGDAGGDTSTFTAAEGKVMATHQHITTQSEGSAAGERLRGLIKISSDVIAGDSGGATYDGRGEVVGMTTAASSGGDHVIGYAIPIAKVVRIAGDLENGAQSTRYQYGSPAFLGVGLGGSSTRVGQVYPGTPAARAGVTPGDTITRVGSVRVRTATQLRSAVTAYSPGDRVRLTWTGADGTPHVATVMLMAGPVA